MRTLPSPSARALPIEVLTAADARVSDLEARKKHFAEELSEQQQAFIGTMRKLADAADEFRSHLELKRRRRTTRGRTSSCRTSRMRRRTAR